mgnify:FL=1
MIKFGENVIKYGHYPDGTLNIKLTQDDINSLISYSRIGWYYDSEEELIVLIYLLNALHSKNITGVGLDMPYVPNARMDRCENVNDVFTLKYFANIINSLGFNFVRTLDTHSTVTEALINNISNESPASYIQFVMGQIVPFTDKELTIFYPDVGSMKRYSKMIKAPCAFGNKVRDWETGKIQNLEVVGDQKLIKDHDILIIDDICSRGGTFYYAAQKLKELGAKDIYLWVSHCENTILDGEFINSGLLKKIYTTDSIYTAKHDLIEVISGYRGGSNND